MDSKIELNKRIIKQECIPLGCVASALYRTGGRFCSGGLCAGRSLFRDGGSLSRDWGGPLSRDWRSLSRDGGLCPGMGVSVQGGPLSGRPPSPVNRMTDTRL